MSSENYVSEKEFYCIVFVDISYVICREFYRAKCESYLIVTQTQSKKAKALGKIYRDELVTVYDINGDWARVSYQGKEGYVLVSYLTYVSNSNETK